MENPYSLTPAQITMYTTEHCADCLRVKAFFDANGIAYVRVQLEGNVAATAFVLKLNNGCKSVPTIIFPDGSVLVEPNWEQLKAKF